ncbi:major facilitator superfamily domain-containing protein [Phthorimaea operculella]|nr:major facilitator superfamily domain-containing protein [Phthorimaea operculella]
MGHHRSPTPRRRRRLRLQRDAVLRRLPGLQVGSRLMPWDIIGALLLDAAAAFVSNLMQSFDAFLAFRFFSGFGIIGATGLVFPYFGDFLSLRHRDVMLCRLEVFWTVGTIILPGIAWVIIRVLKFEHIYGDILDPVFRYSGWRAFVAACGVPSLLVVLMLLPFPESPRYLLHAHRPEEALKVLQKIFTVNTRLDAKDFPVESMLGVEEDGEDDGIVAVDNNNETKAPRSFKQRLEAFWNRKKMLVTPPYIGWLVLCCFVDFGLMFSYYTLMMWFPELFERFSKFTSIHQGVSASVCEVTASLTMMANSSDSDMPPDYANERKCIINDDVYVHTLIVALSCLPTALSVGLTINKIGKKVMLVLMLTTSGAAALGLNWVTSSLQNLILSCIFEAIVSCTEAVLFCVICEIFPTKVAATAMSVTVMCGRIGAIVGNVVFGALVDKHCVVPIYMFGTLLISSGLLCIILPKSTRPERPQV